LIHFGTDGWRGLLATDFTFQNVRAAAESLEAILGDALEEVAMV
jgi:phosphomannomutase